MPVTQAQVPQLIRRFEPVLYFHQAERFFPSDAKRYMENSALWAVNGPPGRKSSWGGSATMATDPFPRSPLLARGDIPVEPISSTFDLPGAATDLFLDLRGWDDFPGVTQTSQNRLADLTEIAQHYGSATDDGLDPKLTKSRFWYHAEMFNEQRLRGVAMGELENALKALLKDHPDTIVLCYYLFFPGSDGPLQGCSEAGASTFASFAGQWTCISIFLEGTTPAPPAPQVTDYKPFAIALTCRSDGTVNDDNRLFGTRAFDWDRADVVGPPGQAKEHPRVFVAEGTHGLYLNTGPQQVKPPRPDDNASRTCGRYETAQAQKQASDQQQADLTSDDDRLLYKFLAFTAYGGLFGGPLGAVVGAVVGFGAVMAEAGGMAGLANLQDSEPAPAPPQSDRAPNVGTAGLVIHPKDVDPPDVGTGRKVQWPEVTDPATLGLETDGRKYSLMVHAGGNPFVSPPWLRPPSSAQGFRGFWGVCVTNDPLDVRVGMKFPGFIGDAIAAFARMKSS